MNFFQALLRLLRWVVQRFREDRCTRVAGALSFTTLLALVPLTAVMFAIFSRFAILGVDDDGETIYGISFQLRARRSSLTAKFAARASSRSGACCSFPLAHAHGYD
jgi:uncharacterized BrkB/YihY/UPF0761 family membrane protein